MTIRLGIGQISRWAGLAIILLTAVVNAQDAPPSEESTPGNPVLLDAGDDQPTDQPSTPSTQPGSDLITFSAFSEGVELTELVEFVGDELGINVSIDPALSGSVIFTSQFSVPRSELLALLNSLLEQQGFTITMDRLGWYRVTKTTEVPIVSSGPLATTRLIRTPNMRPSALESAVNALLGTAAGAPQNRIAYLDDLGVILMTDSPERVRSIQELVDSLVAERDEQRFVRLELVHIAAPMARQRAIELFGGDTSTQQIGRTATPTRQPNQPIQAQNNAGRGIENLTERLRIDPSGNALIFLGRADEVAQVEQVLAVIDVPTSLQPKRYFTGVATRDIAEFASSSGFGEMTIVGTTDESQAQPLVRGQQTNPSAQPISQGGPVMIVDTDRGYIVYYGTEAQQLSFSHIIDAFEVEGEQLVIRTYPLEHSNAEDTADLLMALIQSQPLAGDDGGLLPQNQPGARNNQATQPARAVPSGQPGGDDPAITGHTEDIFITADVANNQLIVKATVNQQNELIRLIRKIDIRRPQVFVDVKIVSISNSDESRVAFETQLVNAGGAGGALSQAFGLTTAPDGGVFTDRRDVSTGLPGLTTALIFSDQLPVVMTAVQTVTDARLIANPTLLVDDNEEASIVNNRQEPFQQSVIANNQTNVNVAFAEAGTKLIITPRISAGGYLRLTYEITLSNFIGQGTDNSPPPIEDRTLRAQSVTIPGDTTIVVGGITVDDQRDTVIKVPFLGDIPLIGPLFRDTRTNSTGSILYVFITPRILKDRHFGGHRLVTEGPRIKAGIDADAPPLDTSFILLADEPQLDQPRIDESEPTPPGRED